MESTTTMESTTMESSDAACALNVLNHYLEVVSEKKQAIEDLFAKLVTEHGMSVYEFICRGRRTRCLFMATKTEVQTLEANLAWTNGLVMISKVNVNMGTGYPISSYEEAHMSSAVDIQKKIDDLQAEARAIEAKFDAGFMIFADRLDDGKFFWCAREDWEKCEKLYNTISFYYWKNAKNAKGAMEFMFGYFPYGSVWDISEIGPPLQWPELEYRYVRGGPCGTGFTHLPRDKVYVVQGAPFNHWKKHPVASLFKNGQPDELPSGEPQRLMFIQVESIEEWWKFYLWYILFGMGSGRVFVICCMWGKALFQDLEKIPSLYENCKFLDFGAKFHSGSIVYRPDDPEDMIAKALNRF